MGEIKHHAIIVTGHSSLQMKKVHKRAKSIFGELASSICNQNGSYKSFLIAPDGGKEGRDRSNDGDRKREEFLRWLSDKIWVENFYVNYCVVVYGCDAQDSWIEKSLEWI